MEPNKLPDHYEAPDQTVQAAHDNLVENTPASETPKGRKKSQKKLGDIALQKVNPLALEYAHELARRSDGTIDYHRLHINEDGTITVTNS